VAGDVEDQEDGADSEVVVDGVVEEASNEVLQQIGGLERRESVHMHGLWVHLAFVGIKTGSQMSRKRLCTG
jgi:hypothetical protein